MLSVVLLSVVLLAVVLLLQMDVKWTRVEEKIQVTVKFRACKK